MCVATRNVTHFNPLEPGVFVIMRNSTHEYIGEVLDIYIGDRGGACKMSPDAEKHWIALTSVAVLQKLPKLKIPGGRMLRT
ncbi:hypothetical protein CY34DRAFT_803034 [Suillus luteus UH-Slu-Lm8-n1]|uniref:Uncharacterized protein n=1 Tax=Suillus luteus UH-Slu-Lm8-n1 TaxID=930992 RepID=A0A0D0A2E3_9AGAM|nr:hypothetical protein CY34DRAFT_803034 [Suillus luteus UH-Slu-Lm8-n1]